MTMGVVKKLSGDKFVLLGVGLSVVLLGELGWVSCGSLLAPPKEKPAYTHLHCPECLEEYPYNPALAGKPCLACGVPGAKLIPTIGSRASGDYTTGEANWGPVLAFLLIAVVLFQTQFFLCVWRLRVMRRQEEEALNQKVTSRCPFCKRKLAYPARLAGTGTLCRHCKTAFILPPPEQETEDEEAE